MRIPGREASYALTDRWRDDCLMGDGSLLVPGSSVWTEENLAALKRWFIDNPDEGERSFEEKLADEADGASLEQRLLFAEVRITQLWPMRDISAASKRNDIKSILDLVGSSATFPEDVDAAAATGFAAYGMARQHKYHHLCLVIERSLAFKRLTPADRTAIAAEPLAWKAFILGSGIKRAGTMENMLLHAVAPDYFEPIATTKDKVKISKAFSDRANGETDVDAALMHIRRSLDAERGEYVWLHDDDVRAVWDPDAALSNQTVRADHPNEGDWRRRWAAFVVDKYMVAGGEPSLTEDPDRRLEVRQLLTQLANTGDALAFLEATRGVEGLRKYWSGPYTWSLREWITQAEDPGSAARRMAEALVAPTSDDEAASRIEALDEIRRPVNNGVYSSVLAAAVWHWQDTSISPWTMAQSQAIAARGWTVGKGVVNDAAVGYLAGQEAMAPFDQEVPWMFAALHDLNRADLGLLALPPVDVERCAAVAAGEEADLTPVLADLETIATNATRDIAPDMTLTTAKSTPVGPEVWVDLRAEGTTVIRLWAHPGGLAVGRQAENEGDTDLQWLMIDPDGQVAPSEQPTKWVGRTMGLEDASSPLAVSSAINAVARRPTAGRGLADLFATYQSEADQAAIAKAQADREELAAGLTSEALAAPDLEALRLVVMTSRYGRPGPMVALDKTLNAAATSGTLPAFGQLVNALCYGSETIAARIDQALESSFSGLGESVIMKFLAVTHPERVLPVFPFKGPMGKSALLNALGIAQPDAGLSRGERQMASNDLLLAQVAPLTTDLWEGVRFLYWLLDQAASPATSPKEPDDEDRLAGVAETCFVDRDWVDEVVELLEDRRQIIMYGPPGTGKTYIAMALAEALAPSASRRHLVQFHPAYSYEDFFEGLRPTTDADGHLTYELRPGPLRNIAAQAEADRDSTYVLLIDEINRANLPKVFGELLFLLEYRDKAVQPMYGGEPFSLPENLLIIATMNTADRSIALVDAALRRRFHFVPMFPNRPPLLRTLHDWLAKNNEDTRIAALLDRTNDELRERGGSDVQIGPSHFMKRGITKSLELVWRYSIEPLIEEQLYGNEAAIESMRWPAAKRRFLSVASADDAVVPVVAAEPAGEYAADGEAASEPGGQNPVTHQSWTDE